MMTPTTASTSEDLLRHAQQVLDELAEHREIACKVCGEAARLYDAVDFALTCNTPRMPGGPSGVPVYYHLCRACGFLFTTFCDRFTPAQWSTHVYNPAYYQDIDPDYAERRPHGNALTIDALLAGHYDQWHGLDYGGGNGRTAQLLRAMGYRYDCHDPFGASDIDPLLRGRYDFCSAFEVAEHTPDPTAFLREIVTLCSPERLAVLVGTHVHDRHTAPDDRLDWWYAAPRNGHISLHSRRSLQVLARRHGLDCLTLTEQTHLLTRGYTPREACAFLWIGKLRTRWRRLLKQLVAST